MKQMLLLAACLPAALASYGQSDSTQTQGNDTINIGSMVIIKKKDANGTTYQSKSGEARWYTGKSKPKRVETSWFTFDFGFNNYQDKTDYSTPEAQNYARAIRPGEADFTSSDFNLRTGKSVNTNLWIFRQKFGVTKNRVLKLTYGVMLELNNYRYDTDLRTSYKKGSDPYVFRDSISFSKNKLALDYVTVPVMIGFDTKPGRGGFTMSAGVSIGYLYSSRNKQISGERGKQKLKGNFDIEPWKFQYIGEIGVGPIMLYGSYAPQTIFKSGLDHMPYNFGIRLGDWDNW
jgi:Outer membrane protein beta-barrel domain